MSVSSVQPRFSRLVFQVASGHTAYDCKLECLYEPPKPEDKNGEVIFRYNGRDAILSNSGYIGDLDAQHRQGTLSARNLKTTRIAQSCRGVLTGRGDNIKAVVIKALSAAERPFNIEPELLFRKLEGAMRNMSGGKRSRTRSGRRFQEKVSKK